MSVNLSKNSSAPTAPRPRKDSAQVFNEAKFLESLWTKVSEPLNAVKIDVKHLFENRYRINIWSGEKLCNNVKITKSYFVLTKTNSEVHSIRKD